MLVQYSPTYKATPPTINKWPYNRVASLDGGPLLEGDFSLIVSQILHCNTLLFQSIINDSFKCLYKRVTSLGGFIRG